MYQLCTIDIWDTLLRRRCHPEAIKLAVAQHLALRCPVELRVDMRDPWPLYEARLEAELAIAQQSREAGKDDEYELREVFQHWLQTCCPALSADVRAILVEDLREHELQVEIENTYADEGIREVLQAHPAQRILYLSDFYMASDLLDKLLAHHGFDKILAGGVVSCDVGLNKRSGNLFAYIQKREGVPSDQHVHIGDNPHSDVDMPKAFGINTVLYQPPEAHQARIARETLFASRDTLFTHVMGQINSLAVKATDSRQGTHCGMFLLGVQAAPLFLGFALFIAEQTHKDRLDRLYFLTREGIFFLRVFDALFANGCHAGLTLPSAQQLPVSRMATFLASVQEVSVDEMNRVWRLNQQQKVSTLLGLLDLEPESSASLLSRHGLALDMLLSKPQEDMRIKALLEDTEFQAYVVKNAQLRREMLRDLLEQNGAGTAQRIGAVDIGWRGTIQDNLANVLPETHVAGYYVALRRLLNPQPENVSKAAYVLDEQKSDEKHLFKSYEALELLCNSDQGSTVSYQRSAGGIVTPVLDPCAEEAQIFDSYVRPFQDGVVFAAQHWAPILASHAVSAQELHPLARKVWAQICDNPPSELIKAYYDAPQCDLFGFGGGFDRKAVPSLGTIFLGVFKPSKRREVIVYLRRAQWTAAIRTLQINPVHKAILLTLHKLARLYKHLVLMRRP